MLMHMYNLVKFCRCVLKILTGKEMLVYIKGRNSITKVQKMMCNIPKLNLIKINASIKFGEILSICSQDIEWRRNSGVNQNP